LWKFLRARQRTGNESPECQQPTNFFSHRFFHRQKPTGTLTGKQPTTFPLRYFLFNIELNVERNRRTESEVHHETIQLVHSGDPSNGLSASRSMNPLFNDSFTVASHRSWREIRRRVQIELRALAHTNPILFYPALSCPLHVYLYCQLLEIKTEPPAILYRNAAIR